MDLLIAAALAGSLVGTVWAIGLVARWVESVWREDRPARRRPVRHPERLALGGAIEEAKRRHGR